MAKKSNRLKKAAAKATTARPAKKSGKKSAAKAVKKPARKPASKAPARRAAAPKDIRTIGTGGGESAGDVGRSLVEMFNKGEFREIEQKFWSPAIVSCEGEGVSMEWVGRRAVARKGEEWYAANRIHGASAEGPFVGASGFAVKFRMDVESLADGTRNVMEEVGVYTIRNGKIVREEFMYGGGQATA